MDGRRLRSVVGSTLAIISSFVLLIVGVPWARAGDLEAKYPNIVPPLFQFGQRGPERGRLIAPRGVAVATDGTTYVADCERGRIVIFDVAGNFRTEFGAGKVSCPSGMTFDGHGQLWVADAGRNIVQRFSAQGEFLNTFPLVTLGNHSFSPADVALDEPRGLVYVVNPMDDRVEVFDRTAHYLRSIGRYGDAPGEFSYPSGIAIDTAGRLYVADKYNDRVEVFDAAGRVPRLFWGHRRW